MDKGLSVKAAARRTRGKVSDGRWYQLESGYQQIKGQHIPISTTAATVAAAAVALDWEPTEALSVAGFSPVDVPQEKPSPLQHVSDDELVAEIADRLARRHGRDVGGSDQPEHLPFGAGFRGTSADDEPRVHRNQQRL